MAFNMTNFSTQNFTQNFTETFEFQFGPYEVFDYFLIGLALFSIFIYIVVLYPVIRYRHDFFDSHYFYKAAFQLAFMDILGLTFNIVYQFCSSCFPMLTRWIPYFMTQGMLVIIAFNRFSAIVLCKYYSKMYKSRLATWAFLVPIIITIGLCGPMYSSVAC